MSIKATAPKRIERELIPQGMHVARCYSMVHIGTVEWEWKGEKKQSDKVRLTFELPNEMRVFSEEKGSQPMVIDREYTLSMYEKANLRQDLENWRGAKFTEQEADDFDITKLLGTPCMLNVIHNKAKNENVYANIGNINPLMKGMSCPDQINSTFEFNYTDKFDYAWVEDQPDFIQDAIKSTPEYQARTMDLSEKEQLKRVAAEGFNTALADDMNQIPQEMEDQSDDLPY